MESEELESADAVGRRLATVIEGLGQLSSKDAIALVWNEFGGQYCTRGGNWLGLRKDVLKVLHAHGNIYYRRESHQWLRC